ncbi:phage holin family protein [Lonepinella sp. MS14437]|uniref:phage holin family protein n=1 Tax=unclassified Lonepinella TaxID=2642006 RepID=UPI0036DE75F0
MQAIQNIKTGVKNMLITLLELAQVRLDMARIELIQQKEQLVITLISALLFIVFLLITLISGLFAVNVYFEDPSQRLIAFLTISGITLLLAVAVIFIILNSLKKQRTFMQNTLEEVKLDIATLKQAANSTNKHE